MQSLAQAERPPFSWKKGLLHAFAAAATLGVLTSIAAAGLSPQSSYLFGRAIARDLLWVFAFAFVASYGFQTRRKILGWVMLVLSVVVVGADGVILFQTAHRLADSDRPLTEAERARPARDARQPRLCQAALGVSFPDPGQAFGPAPAVEKRLQSRDSAPNIANWIWEKLPETGERVLLQIIHGSGSTEKSFRGFAAGTRSGFAENPKMKLSDESLRWTGGHGEYNVIATLDSGVHIQIHCLSRGWEGDLSPVTACLQTFTGEGDPLRAVRNGLDLGGCGK